MKFIIADNSLVNFMGHSYEYARSIFRTAQSEGFGSIVLANRAVITEITKAIEVIPCFRYGLDHQFRPRFLSQFGEWNYFRHDQALFYDLKKNTASLKLSAEDILLFHTVRHNQLKPVIRWAEQLPRKKCPHIVFILHFTAFPTFDRPSSTAKFYSRAFKYLENSPVKERFRLFTDSQMLADEYSNYTDLPVDVVGIPHATQPHSNNFPISSKVKDELVFTYLGDARVNKGFHLLPYLVKELQKKHGVKIRFELQANQRNGNEWQINLAKQQLRETGATLIEKDLPTSDYYSLLHRADVILLPYTLDYYHSQSSGIFGEAISEGKPVIVPRGTWMAQQLREFPAGLAFYPQDRQSLLDCSLAVIDRYCDFKELSLESAPKWRRKHNPVTYTETIINACNS